MHIPIYTNLTDKAKILSILQTALPKKDFDYIELNQDKWTKTSAKKHFEKIVIIDPIIKNNIIINNIIYFLDKTTTLYHIKNDKSIIKSDMTSSWSIKYILKENHLALINAHY